MTHAATPLALVAALCLLASCAGQGTALRANASRAYPADVPGGPTLPIQVIRRVTFIEMTNTTAHSFGPSTLWLNRRFSLAIDGMAVGQTLTLDLRQFRDEFGETFRAGGFFATRDPDALVLVELEHDDTRSGLVMVGNLLD